VTLDQSVKHGKLLHGVEVADIHAERTIQTKMSLYLAPNFFNNELSVEIS
jgi:hypothetical protein